MIEGLSKTSFDTLTVNIVEISETFSYMQTAVHIKMVSVQASDNTLS